jgi:hypothetical protein
MNPKNPIPKSEVFGGRTRAQMLLRLKTFDCILPARGHSILRPRNREADRRDSEQLPAGIAMLEANALRALRFPPQPSCPHVRSTLVVMSPPPTLALIILQWPLVNSFSAFCSQSRWDRPRSSSCCSSSTSGRTAAHPFSSTAEHRPARPLRDLPTPRCA